MTCPFHDESSEEDGETDEGSETRRGSMKSGRGVERRDFLRSALAIGGAAALETTLGLAGMPDGVAAADEPVGVAERLNRQHAWDAYEFQHPEKGSLPPARHVLLHLHYDHDGTPTDAHRREATAAFRELETLLGWGPEGVLFTVGYSPAYFDRFRSSDDEVVLPPALDRNGGLDGPQGLIRAGDLINRTGVTLDRERPVVADSDENAANDLTSPSYDACIHLSSDHDQTILAAEELLWGGAVDVDGDGEAESLDHTLEGIFTRPTSYPARRVGFAGPGNLKEEGGAGSAGDNDGSDIYPEDVPVDRPDGEVDAKLSMGFNDLFRNSIPGETNVTILEDQKFTVAKPPGVFAQGTIKHVSKLDMNLDAAGDDPGFTDDPAGTGGGWYQHDAQGRAERMFSPDHDVDDMGVVGEDLGSSNAPHSGPEGGDPMPIRDLSRSRDSDAPADLAERAEADANAGKPVGHVQKVGRARFDMETRLTDDVPDDHPFARERDDDLRGHDGTQEAEQVMLRRDFNTVDRERPGLHFVALMRFNPYMAYMRQAMNGVEFDSAAFRLDGDERIQHGALDVDPADDGIVGFCSTQRRANYLVPPITLRGLPPARAARPSLSVAPARDGTYSVVDIGAPEVEVALSTVGADAPGPSTPDAVDLSTVRFGEPYSVNMADGARPSSHRIEDVDGDGSDELVVTVPTDGTGFARHNFRARLFAKTDAGYPVFATDRPVVAVEVTAPETLEVGQTGSFVVRDDPDRPVAGYEWDFTGDGAFSTSGAAVEHAFSEPGTHEVTLRVTIDDGSATETHDLTRTVTVELPPVVGDRVPTDPDGDGRYEDVNGDGTADVVDVQALWAQLDSAAVQDHPAAYNFAGTTDPTEVTEADVQALYESVSGGDGGGS